MVSISDACWFYTKILNRFVSSDRSSCSDDGLLDIHGSNPLFQIFTQSFDAIDVTSVSQSRFNSVAKYVLLFGMKA